MEAFESVICPIKAIMLSKPDIYFSLTGSFVFHAAEGIMNQISQIDKIPLPVKSGSAPFRPFPASIVFPLLVWFGRGGSNVLGKSKTTPYVSLDPPQPPRESHADFPPIQFRKFIPKSFDVVSCRANREREYVFDI